jgi:hypothetical protein
MAQSPWTETGRQPEESHCRPRPVGKRRLQRSSKRRGRINPASLRKRRPRIRRDALVGCAVVRQPSETLGRREVRKPFSRLKNNHRRCLSLGSLHASPSIGGQTGWYYGNWLWQLRGFMDLLVGGVGIRRGRRDPDVLHAGEPLDCWRVEAIETDHLLRLAAEMRLPGRA